MGAAMSTTTTRMLTDSGESYRPRTPDHQHGRQVEGSRLEWWTYALPASGDVDVSVTVTLVTYDADAPDGGGTTGTVTVRERMRPGRSWWAPLTARQSRRAADLALMAHQPWHRRVGERGQHESTSSGWVTTYGITHRTAVGAR